MIYSGSDADIKVGNTLPVANIPTGTFIHNIELYPARGAQLARSAGVMAQLISKEGGVAQVRLPSGEVRIIRLDCKATIGRSVTLSMIPLRSVRQVRPAIRASARPSAVQS